MWNNPQALTRASSMAFAFAILILLAGLVWRAANDDMFAVQGIDVVGDIAHVTGEQVGAIAVRELRGTFFTVDLRSAQTAFEKLPWVRQVDIRRRWPNRLEVAVQEHRELARWGNTALVNRHGEVFEGASNKQLPVFEGPPGSSSEVARSFLRFNKSLTGIGRRVDSIELSERRAWRLRLDDGTVIELGRDRVVERLNAFVTAYGRSVAQLEGKTVYVDLRYANGFAVRVNDKKRSEVRV